MYWKIASIIGRGQSDMSNKGAPDILRQIVASKELRVECQKKEVPLSELESRNRNAKRPLNFSGSLMGVSVRIIAEIKRASPSKGTFGGAINARELSRSYSNGGAAAVSVLTNEDHFKGSIRDLTDVHEAVYADGLPVLRKEFIFDSYQIHESRAYGADAILLIVSMLSKQQILDFMDIAASLSLQCLVEVHDDDELDIAVDCGAEIIGINNRNLRTFETSLETTELLAPRIPAGKIVVSESGISNKMDIERVRLAGAHAVLVGESLVRSNDPSHALRLLM